MNTATQTVDGAQMVNGALAAFQARERDDAAYLLAKAVQANPALGARWASVSTTGTKSSTSSRCASTRGAT